MTRTKQGGKVTSFSGLKREVVTRGVVTRKREWLFWTHTSSPSSPSSPTGFNPLIYLTFRGDDPYASGY